MAEIWDILDERGNKTGMTMEAGKKLLEGFFHLGVDIWIINSKSEILIEKRVPQKKNAKAVWSMIESSVIKGETSLQAIEREVHDELGVKLNMENLELINHYKTETVWLDTYFIRQDIDLNDIVLKEDEIMEVKWATYDDVRELFEGKQFMKNRWEFARDLIRERIKDSWY